MTESTYLMANRIQINQIQKKYFLTELARHAIKNFRDKTPNQDLTGVEMLRELRYQNSK